MTQQVPTFNFLKDDMEVCARPLLASNLVIHKGASSPVVQIRTGEWAFLVINPENGKLDGNGPHETEADAFRAWVDFMTFAGKLPVLPLITTLEHSEDQSDITTRNESDFEKFAKGLL